MPGRHHSIQLPTFPAFFRERWTELPELAANEHGPQKMLDLVREIKQVLAQKQDRLNEMNPKTE